jgi:hypothetical protein
MAELHQLRHRRDYASALSTASSRTTQVSNQVCYYECPYHAIRAVGTSLDGPVMVAWYVLPLEWLPYCPKWPREVFDKFCARFNR